MRDHPLQEVAKLAAGLVAADFLWLLWFSQQKTRVAEFFGMTLTPEMVLPGLIFDVAIFIILVHYAWHIGKIPSMRERSYVLVAGALFVIIAAAHVWRLFTGAELIIEGWRVPLWLSWLGVAVTSYLAYTSFHFAARLEGPKKRK